MGLYVKHLGYRGFRQGFTWFYIKHLWYKGSRKEFTDLSMHHLGFGILERFCQDFVQNN